MKKKIAILAAVLLVLFPKTSHADLDVLSIFEDTLKSFQEKMNTVVHTYLGYQINLQELASNHDIVNQLKNKVKTELEAQGLAFTDGLKSQFMEFLNTKLSNMSLPGIGTGITLGSYVSPQLKQQVGITYFKRQNVRNDVQVTIATDLRNNNLLAGNLGVIFANALVNRKKLMTETANLKAEEENKEDNPDVNTVMWHYGETLRRANHRWLEILGFEAAYRKTLSEMQMTGGRIDDISEIIGEDEKKAMENMAAINGGLSLNGSGNNPLNLSDIGGQARNILGDIKNGNYANAFSAAAGMYSNAPGSREGISGALGSVSSGLGAAQDIYNNGASGNIGGVIGALGQGAGSLTGNDTFSNLGSGAGGAVNSALQGNWSDALSGGASTAGGMVGGNTGSDIGGLGSVIGGGLDVINHGGSAEDVLNNISTNSGIRSGLDAIGDRSGNDGNANTEGK